jgi:hypothetical protein
MATDQITTSSPAASAPSGAPDLSALTQPGPQAAPSAPLDNNAPATSAPADLSGATPQPNLATATAGSMQPYLQKENEAISKAGDLANAPAPNVNVPHGRLLAMIQGLGAGLSSFGTAIATHGREGGAPEAESILASQQERQQRARDAAMTQRNAQVQQQLMVADTNHKLAQNVLLMATLPTDLALSDLRLPAAQASLVAGQAEAAKTQAEFMSQYGMNTQQFNNMVSGNPSAVDPKAAQNLNDFASQRIAAAGKILRPDDPYLVKAQQVLADTNSAPQDIFGAVSSVNRQLGLQGQVQEARTKKEAADANSPVAKLATPEALAAPGAQAAIQAKIADPTTDPNDIPRLRSLLPQAAVAQFNAENIKQREARNTQVLSQGDPDAAGKLLADRSLTIEELKSRQVTPQFIVQAVKAAQRIDPNYKVAEASGQARIAAAPANQQFFGNTDSLLVKGGTLDQLDAAGKALGNTQIPAFNSVANLTKAALGKGPQAAYAAAILGVSDDWSKVMAGGQGSDTSRQQAVDIINKNLSPEGRSAAVAQIRKAVTSQRNGRIGLNPYMKDMYPDPSTRQETPGIAGTQPAAPAASTPVPASPAGATHTAKGSDGHLHYTNTHGQDLGIVPGK